MKWILRYHYQIPLYFVVRKICRKKVGNCYLKTRQCAKYFKLVFIVVIEVIVIFVEFVIEVIIV